MANSKKERRNNKQKGRKKRLRTKKKSEVLICENRKMKINILGETKTSKKFSFTTNQGTQALA